MFGLQASDLNLVTAVLVALALIMPKMKGNKKLKKGRAPAEKPVVSEQDKTSGEVL